jgi:lysozyme family protein
MANVNLLAPFILAREGGFSNRKADKGGPTNKGVTLTTWRSVGYDKDGDGDIDVDDLRLLTDDEVINRVLKPHYWDRYRADQINSQSVANICVDWLWMSGKPAITKVQALLALKADGIVGPKTIAAINAADPKELFTRIKQARFAFYAAIVAADPTQKANINGWHNRLNAMNYED